MDLSRFRGVFPAQIVPFHSDESIDETALREILRLNLGKGVTGFYVCGSTGEGFLMSLEERKRVLGIVNDEVSGECTVIAHVGAISTKQTIELGEHAESLGVDAISVVPPFYYPFRASEIVDHYVRVSESVDLPMIIYHIPGTTGVSLSLEHLGGLFSLERIIGIKFSSSDLFRLERIKSLDPDIVVLFGSDEMLVGGLSMGADGSIGSTLNSMPEKYLRIRTLIAEEKLAEALEVQKGANAIVEVLLENGLYAGIKYGLSRLGVDCGVPRLPFSPLTEKQKGALDSVFEAHL